MSNKLIKRSLLSILVIVFCFGFSTISASNSFNKTETRSQLVSAGVEISKVDYLVEKLERGELLDSMKEEYSNIAPVLEVTTSSYYIAKYVYPDGSVVNIEIVPRVYSGSITGGTFNGGSYWYTWRNARVLASWGVVTASFYADMQGSTGLGRIDAIRDWGIITIGGTFNLHNFSIVRANATSSIPAQVRLFFSATALQNFGQATFYLRLYVPYRGLPYARLSVLN